DPPEPFSFLTERITTPQIVCHITETNPRTHAVIRANLDRSPLYGGDITGVGPRYCPSIEDKVVPLAFGEPHHVVLDRRAIARAHPGDVDRGQGGAVRRTRAAPDFLGAGRSRRRHDLPER